MNGENKEMENHNNHGAKKTIGKGASVHIKKSARRRNYSLQPSSEKDYDIALMTGNKNNVKGSDKNRRI